MNDFDQQLDEAVFLSEALELANKKQYSENLLALDPSLLAQRLDEIWPIVQQDRAEVQDALQTQRNEKIAELRSGFEAAFIRDFGIKFWSDCSKANAIYFLNENKEALIWAIPVGSEGNYKVFNLFHNSFYEKLAKGIELLRNSQPDSREIWSFSTEQEIKVHSRFGFHPILFKEGEDKTITIQKCMARVRYGCLED
jgi:hypothetical protein